jgi:glutamate 5-kinase
MTDLGSYKRVVVKIGSALLVDGKSGRLKRDWLAGLASDVAQLRAQNTEVILVSSGSIALGRRVLALPDGELPLEQSQAAAAVGQIQLARAYQEVLEPLGITTAQILMTLEDSENRRRYLNSRTTLATLLQMGIVAIVNENDTVATDEIRFGDNDRLAAQVAVMSGADLLILLSDVDGLYTGDPRTDNTATLIPTVDEITPQIEAVAGDAGTGLSKGGMKTKVMAAKTVTKAGCGMIITKGNEIRPLFALTSGATSTYFAPVADPKTARKQWIAGMKMRGSVVIDAGAARALAAGKSLLPAGVTDAIGEFSRGDPVEIKTTDSTIGSGLISYDSAEVLAIRGRQSKEISEILGYPGRVALIHRDDMVI